MKCYLVKLVMMRQGCLCMEPAGEETRLFSSMKAAETWLSDNGFVYGQCRFFKHSEDGEYWFHKDAIPMEYINVHIEEMDVDDVSGSKFEDLKAIHREWGL